MSAHRPRHRRHQAPVIDLRADLHGHATDYASDLDRAWFAEHPGAQRYQRAPVDHEFCAPGLLSCTEATGVVLVVVTQIRPGLRTRAPFLLKAAS